MTFHKPFQRAAIGLAILATLSSARCQHTMVAPPIAQNHNFEWAVLGRFLGNSRQCAIVTVNGAPHLAFDVGRASSLIPLVPVGDPLTGITGMVTLPTTPAQPGDDVRDTLLIASNEGLSYARFVDPENGLPEFTVTAVADSVWVGATQLAVTADTTGVRVAGRSADQFHVLFAASPAEPTELETSAIWTSPALVRVIHWRDWYGTGVVPVVQTTSGTGTLAVNDQLVVNCQCSASSMVSLPVQVAGADQVGFLWNGLASPQLSVLWGSSSCGMLERRDLPTSGLTMLGQLPTAVATFDLNGDGTSEMLISRRGDFTFWFVHPRQAPQPFTLLDAPVGNPTLNTVPIFWGNFCGDRKPDLVAFLNSGVVVDGQPKRAMICRRSVVPDLPGNPEWFGNIDDGGGGGGRLLLSNTGIPLPMQLQGEEQPMLVAYTNPDVCTAGRVLHYAVWHQNCPYDAQDNVLPDVPTTDPYAEDHHFTSDGTSMEIGAELSGSHETGDHFYLDLRLFEDGKLVQAEIYGIAYWPTGSDTEKRMVYLRSLAEQSSIAALMMGGNPVGGIIETNVLPPFPQPPKTDPVPDTGG